MTIRLDAAGYDRRWNLVGAGRGGVMGRIYRHPFNPLQNSLGISVRAFCSEATNFGPFVPASQIVGLCVFESQSLPSKHNFCNPSPPSKRYALPSAIPPFQIQCKYGKRNLSGHGMACPSPFGTFSLSIATLPLSFVSRRRSKNHPLPSTKQLAH